MGMISVFLGLLYGFELFGIAGYIVGLVGSIGSTLYFEHRSPVTMTDERERRLRERAAYVAMVVTFAIAVSIGSVLLVLEALGVYEFSQIADALIRALGAFVVLYGLSYAAVNHVL